MSCVLQLMLLLLLCVGVRGGEECPDNWVVDYDSGSTCVPCNAGNTRKGEGGTCKSCAFYEVTPNRGDNYCHSFDYNNCEARVSGACNCPNTDCRTSECRWPSAPLYYTYDGDPEYITRIEGKALCEDSSHNGKLGCDECPGFWLGVVPLTGYVYAFAFFLVACAWALYGMPRPQAPEERSMAITLSVMVSICNATTDLAYMLTTPFESNILFAVAVVTLVSPAFFFSRALYKKGIVYRKCYILPLWALGCALYSTKLIVLKPINNRYYRWLSGTDDHFMEAAVDTATLDWAMMTSAIAACIQVNAQYGNYYALVELAQTVYDPLITAMQVSVLCSCVLVGCVAIKKLLVWFPGLCPLQQSCVSNKGDDASSGYEDEGEDENEDEAPAQGQGTRLESGVSSRDVVVGMDGVAVVAAGTGTGTVAVTDVMRGMDVGEAGLLRKMITKLERTVEKLDRKVNEQSQVIIEMLTHQPHEAE